MDEEIEGPGLDERHLGALKERVSKSPFHRWAGLELISVGDGRAELAMDLRPHHFNPQGIVHGGIITAVADTAIGLALRSQLGAGLTHRTAQLNVHFLAKGEGNRLVGRGRAIHLGRRMGYGESEVIDGQGRLLARASGTFMVLPAPGAF
ncbi:MAG TPA: PaaI family thioesterase [Actinomycetota bacterium]|nr:PaaI family thioesterase [Actinomycetota bacterium]